MFLARLDNLRPPTPILPRAQRPVSATASDQETVKLTSVEYQGVNRCLACRSALPDNMPCLVRPSGRVRAKQPACERCRSKQVSCLFDSTLNDIMDHRAQRELFSSMADAVSRDTSSREWTDDLKHISSNWQGERGVGSRDRVMELIEEIQASSLEASRSMRLFCVGNPVLQQEVTSIVEKRNNLT